MSGPPVNRGRGRGNGARPAGNPWGNPRPPVNQNVPQPEGVQQMREPQRNGRGRVAQPGNAWGNPQQPQQPPGNQAVPQMEARDIRGPQQNGRGRVAQPGNAWGNPQQPRQPPGNQAVPQMEARAAPAPNVGRGPARGARPGGRPNGSAQPQQAAGNGDLTSQLAKTSINEERPGNHGESAGRGGISRKPVIDENAMVLRTRPETAISKKGNAGTPIQLCANFFKLEKRPKWVLYQYRVDFSEEEDRINVKRAWINEHKKTFGKSFIFDGTVIYTVSLLSKDKKPIQLVSKRTSDEKLITINIKFVRMIEDGDPVFIQVFNLIIRRCMGKLNLQLAGRNLYDPEAAVNLPEVKLSIWPGYLTSVRQHEDDLLMCVEFIHKVTRQDTALDVITGATYSSRGASEYQNAVYKAMLGTIVMTPYNNKTYRVDEIDFTASPLSKFATRDGEMTFQEYFNQRYQRDIRDLNQPMLVSRPKARNVRSGQPENIYLVPELCVMTGLTEKMRTDYLMMRAVKNVTQINPRSRVDKLIEFNKRLLCTPGVKSELDGWDMDLSPSLVHLTGRELPREVLVFGRNQKLNAGVDADWTRTSFDKPMLVSADFNSFVIVTPAIAEPDVQTFWQNIRKIALKMEFKIPTPEIFKLERDGPAAYCDAVERIVARIQPDLILFVLNNNNADRYAAAKKKCSVDRAICSQMMLRKNLTSKQAMTIATKLAIQLNCKLGGAPWTVDSLPPDTMVVGFDVYHDSRDRRKSFGATVATLNRLMTSWFSTVASHENGEELSNTFPQDVIKACRRYHDFNKKLPARIVVYRDGVGDGQLGQVCRHEVENLKKELTLLYGGETWKLLYLIVTKRINTRFFKADKSYGNVSPGTVIDDVVTLPEKYDFYMVSQKPTIGTASPTAYNIISDNMGWSVDQIQRLTYKLTHVYYNFSGTVSVPAPCQYAHKFAFQVGQFLHMPPNASLSDRLHFI